MTKYTFTEKKDTRSGFGAGLHELGRNNPNVVALCADLTGSLKMDAFKKELKIQAVKAARDKAVYLAAAINEKAGEAININEPNEVNQYPQPMYANRMMKAESALAADNEQTPHRDCKQIKLPFEVNVTFALQYCKGHDGVRRIAIFFVTVLLRDFAALLRVTLVELGFF